MEKLFGIPMNGLMVALLSVFIALVAVLVALVVRNPVLFRLSIRNIPRRKGRSALIVFGLMLATTIMVAAFNTGDTMTHTIRSLVLNGLGPTDEVISAQEESDIEVTGESAQLQYFEESRFDQLRQEIDGHPLIDGLMPAIVEEVAVQNPRSRQNEPRVQLVGLDPRYMAGFGEPTDGHGRTLPLADLKAGEVYLNEEGMKELKASPGDTLSAFVGGRLQQITVKSEAAFLGANPSEPAMVLPLATAQTLFAREGQIKHILVSNRGDDTSGADLTDEVMSVLEPKLLALGLSAEPTKKDDLQAAEDAGSGVTSFFMTFGTFSIMAGILLIFLIFVMLAAERKSEMGIARAVGAQRSHLIQMFMLEGLAYDVAAGAVGVLLGIAVAYGMVFIMAAAFATFGLEIEHDLRPRSLIVAYTLGVLLTFAVVTFSAWRVSVLNIVTAIRNLPEPVSRRAGKATLVLGLVAALLGALIAVAGLSSKQAAPFYLGTSLVIVGLVPVIRWFRVPDRIAYTFPGIALVVWWLLPWRITELFLPRMDADLSIFILSGAMVVTGATWVVMYNSDQMLALFSGVLSRFSRITPAIKTAVAYPLKNRFRTGMTLAMFTLVVFTLVTGAITTGSFTKAWGNEEFFAGGFQIRATTLRLSPIGDMKTAIAQSSDLNPGDFEVIGSQSLALIDARQADIGNRDFGAYPIRGMDDEFLSSNEYEFALIAPGYDSSRDVWNALKADPTLAVVDALPAPRHDNWGFGAPTSDFKLEGFYMEDGKFSPIKVEVRDPATGKISALTVIAVLKDASPYFMIGISTSQRFVETAFPDQAQPTTYFFRLREGSAAAATAESLESAFLEQGMQAEVLKDLLDDSVAANNTLIYIIQGFMGLGLVVGVAALGVISARAVVERRQEIGVMRSIGFERWMVQLSFLLESSFIALGGILIGTALGLMVAYNVVSDAARQPSWDNMTFAVPWLNLAVIYLVVYAAALLATYLPARQASRVYPAEALRYE